MMTKICLSFGARSFAIWVPRSRGFIPDYAVKCGDDVNGVAIYIGRAFHDGNLLPGKVIPSEGMAYVTYAGITHMKDKYEAGTTNNQEVVTASLFSHL